MYRLVYVSTARDGLGENDIGDILDVSQSNNHERFVTGFLAHNRRHFMQALEGPEEEVRLLYDRIRADPRHGCLTQIVGERIGARAFDAWSMNYFRVDSEAGAPAMVLRRDEAPDRLMPASTPAELRTLFARFLTVR